MRKIALCIFVLSSTFISCRSTDITTNDAVSAYLSTAVSSTYDIPTISEWLIYKNNTYADWLGIKYHNKYLREPINVIIIDSYSDSASQAVKKLMRQCKSAGYEEEYGHSSGYKGIINNETYKQIPNNKHVAFANKDFFEKYS